MDECCGGSAEIAALRGRQARVLKVVFALNAAMFLIEFIAGVLAHSTALMAGSIDMGGDALVYALSLYVINRGPRWHAEAAKIKGVVTLAVGVWILIEASLKLAEGVTPLAPWMAGFGALALGVNLLCLRLLWPLRNEDINLRSSFECSRNNAISNCGVLLAAVGVWAASHAWPDILVGLIVAALFLRSALRVLRRAWPELRASAARA